MLIDLKKYILSGAIKFDQIRICSVILGELAGVFSKLQGLQSYFPENFRCNLTYYESENFSDCSLHHIFESVKF